MDPTIPWFYIYRTECETDEKNILVDLTKAIELLPEEESLYEMRAGFYDLVGEMKKAVQDYEWLLQRRPDDPEILYLLGSCLLNLDEVEKGRAYLERVIRLDPKGDMGKGAQELLDEFDR
ncbi:MAG: tetratricopeptide repeat protein [Brevinematales bacterium]